MGMRINTNISSINAQTKLTQTSKKLRSSMEKLASGERINRAADDAAGLAISESMRSSIRSLNVARRNANDGISVIQTAEGGLMETSNMLIRLRELAIQGASDTVGQAERSYLDKEFIALKNEIDRIASSTEFNGTRLLVGKSDVPEGLNSNANAFPLEIQVSQDYFENADAIEIKNPVNIIKIDFSKLNGYTSGEDSLEIGRDEDGTRVDTKTNAQNSIQAIDKAITRINEHRSYLGSVQNRLDSTISNLNTRIENLAESKSRIRDTDFAAQTALLTQAKILQQAGTAVLSNANTQPQIALSLLSQ